MSWRTTGNIGMWVRIGISAGLLTGLLFATDLTQVGSVVSQSHPGYLLAALLVACADRAIMAYKWNVLLRAKNIQVPFIETLGTYLISTFFGLFLPATIGGDVLRAVAFSKRGCQVEDILSSILVERVWGAVALLLMVGGSIGLAYQTLDPSVLEPIRGALKALVVFCAALGGLVLLMVSPFLGSLVRRGFAYVESYNRFRVMIGKVRNTYESYRGYNAGVGTLAWFFVLSVVENILPIFACFFTALALNIPVPIQHFVILVPIILLLGRLPISFDGAGIHEGLFVVFLPLVGIDRSDALFLGLVSHAIGIVAVLPGGLLFSRSGINYRAIASQHEKPSPKPTLA